MSKSTRTALLWLVLALLLAFWLGARHLNTDLIWIDEMYSIGNIGGLQKQPFNPLEVLESIRIQSPQHTPGYFILLAGWAGLVGWEPLALRALSLFTGLLAIAWTYRLGRDLASPHVGLYAALILSTAALYIYYLHELRMYTLIVTLTAFTTWVYWRILNRPRPGWWAWGGLFVGGVGLIYAHYYAALPLAAIGLYHLLLAPKNRRWWLVAGVLALIGLTFLPYLEIFRYSLADLGDRREDLRDDALSPIAAVQSTIRLFSHGIDLLLIVLGAAGLVAGFRKRRGARVILFLGLALLGVTLASNVVTGTLVLRRARYLLALWPLLALLVGLGLAEFQRRIGRWTWALLAAWLVIGLFTTTMNPDFLSFMDGPRHIVRYPPLREMVDALQGRIGSEDLLVGVARSADVYTLYKLNTIGEYYLADLATNYYFIGIDDWRAPDTPTQQQALRDQSANRLAVWFAYEPDQVDTSVLDTYLPIIQANYTRCGTVIDTPHLRIDRYDPNATGCLPTTPPADPLAVFGGGIQLSDVRLVQDDRRLTVIAGWQIMSTVPPDTYSVSFKLRDGDDQYVAQGDYGLRSAGFGWQQTNIALESLSSGDYTLTATVYDWRTGERLNGQLEAAESDSDIVPIRTLTIP
jgi:hypothetical protein